MRLWRTLHYLSFLTYVLFVVHGILSGSDSKQSWMIAIYTTSVLLVLFFIFLRIFKKQIALKVKPKPTAELPKHDIETPKGELSKKV